MTYLCEECRHCARIYETRIEGKGTVAARATCEGCGRHAWTREAVPEDGDCPDYERRRECRA